MTRLHQPFVCALCFANCGSPSLVFFFSFSRFSFVGCCFNLKFCTKIMTVAFVLFFACVFAGPPYNDYRIGRGIFDVTGPVTEVGFMGMGQLGQTGKGLHFRLYARAFVVESIPTGRRTVYMSADLCMIYQHIHDYVIEVCCCCFI
jgi:hypothetical protein